jgi:hypothetical protein
MKIKHKYLPGAIILVVSLVCADMVYVSKDDLYLSLGIFGAGCFYAILSIIDPGTGG